MKEKEEREREMEQPESMLTILGYRNPILALSRQNLRIDCNVYFYFLTAVKRFKVGYKNEKSLV